MSICLNHDFLPCSLLLFLSNILFRKPPNNNLKLSKITLSDDHFQIPPPSNTKLTHAGGGVSAGESKCDTHTVVSSAYRFRAKTVSRPSVRQSIVCMQALLIKAAWMSAQVLLLRKADLRGLMWLSPICQFHERPVSGLMTPFRGSVVVSQRHF